MGALKEYALTKSGSSYKESAVYDVKGRLQEITYTGTVSRTDVFRHSESAVENIQQITTGDYVIKPNQDIYQRYTGKEVLISGIKVDYEEIAYLKETDHLTNLPKEITYKNDYLTYKYDSNGNITQFL